MFHDMGGYGWGMGFGWVFVVLFWVLVIVGIVAIVTWLSGGGRRANTALQILQERYARGEIDQQEYQQKRQDLEH